MIRGRFVGVGVEAGDASVRWLGFACTGWKLWGLSKGVSSEV
jgi:hypothetical protein